MASKGIKELKVALGKVEGDVHRAVDQAVAAEARAIFDDEYRTIPVATGELRSGLAVRRGDLSAEVGIFDSDLFWAVWIEWGRSSAPAQPFATPAAERARTRWPKRAADAVKKAVEES